MNFYHGDRYIIKFNETDGKYWKYLEKNFKKYEFTGNEKWVANKPWNEQFPDFAHYFTDELKDWKIGQKNAVSNLFAVTDQSDRSFFKEQLYCANLNKSVYFFISNKRLSTPNMEGLIKWIKENKTIIVYELADEYKQLIPLEPIDIMNMTYYPLTNCFTSVNNILLKAKYYRDFVNTIRNLQVDNGTLKAQLQDIEKRLQVVEAIPTTIETTEEEVIPNA